MTSTLLTDSRGAATSLTRAPVGPGGRAPVGARRPGRASPARPAGRDHREQPTPRRRRGAAAPRPRNAPAGPGAREPGSALLGAVAHLVAELLPLLAGGRLELRADDVAHRLDPVGDQAPPVPVPLLDDRHAVRIVVVAGDLERPHHALHPELLEPLVGEIQVLEAPADLLGRQRLVAVLRHRGADRL